MASPHAAGVAALIWSLKPNATSEQVRMALLDGAFDLGAVGHDNVFGWGYADALSSAKRIAPELFPTTPRKRGARP